MYNRIPIQTVKPYNNNMDYNNNNMDYNNNNMDYNNMFSHM